MPQSAAAVVAAFLLFGSSGCVCSCGDCAFIPTALVGGVVRQAQVNVERVPVRKDLAVVLKGEPEPTAPEWSRYRQAAERVERYGRRANEVIDEEHWTYWRRPRVLAGRDYPNALRLTGRSDPDSSLSMAKAIHQEIDRLLAPEGGGGADDADGWPAARRYPVPATVRPRLLALRGQLEQLVVELKPRAAWREETTADGTILTVRQTPSSR